MDQVLDSPPVEAGTSLSDILGKGEPTEQKPKTPVASVVEPTVDAPTQETEAPPKEAKPTPPVAESSDDATLKETLEKKTKEWEKKNFQQREAKRRAEEKAASLERTLAKLKQDYGIQEEELVEPHPMEAALHQERVTAKLSLSKAHFLKTHGEAVYESTINGDEAPWLEIERRSKVSDGQGGFQWNPDDPEAVQLAQRALAADDPFEEVLVILKEQELFRKHGTSSMLEILEKERGNLDELKAQLKDELKQEMNTTTSDAPVSPPPVTLSGVGSVREAQTTSEPETFTLTEILQGPGSG